jgi:hypothetical protein
MYEPKMQSIALRVRRLYQFLDPKIRKSPLEA